MPAAALLTSAAALRPGAPHLLLSAAAAVVASARSVATTTAVTTTASSSATTGEATPPETGATYTLRKRFTAAEVASFLSMTGDANPLHSDVTAARAHGFAAPILPGILTASLLPAVIGTRFPGAVYATQTLNFRAAAAVGQEVEARVMVRKASGRRVLFDTAVLCCATGSTLVDGSALALLGGEGGGGGSGDVGAAGT